MLTAAQLSARTAGIGASECAALLGLDPFRSAWDVWAEKTGKLEPEKNGSDAMKLGNDLEPLLLKRCSLAIGKAIVRPTSTYKHRNGIQLANLDGQVERAARGQPNVEAKSSMLAGEWGPPGTDDVPRRVLVQVTSQMDCSDSRETYVTFADTRYGIRGFDVRIYHVDFNPELARIIEDAVGTFWDRHVKLDIPPENSVGSAETFRRIKRQAGKCVALDDGLVRAVIEARDARLNAEKREKEVRAALETQMRDAELGECSFGLVEYRAVSVKGYAVEPRTDRRLVLPKGTS